MDTATQEKYWIDKISTMGQVELCRLRRFAPVGSPVFINPVIYEHFQRRFKEMGGMTPEISKEIGWGD